MKSHFGWLPWFLLILLPLILCGCGPDAPVVQLGYLKSGDYNVVPTAFVDFEPGMTISAALSPWVEDPAVKHSFYTETITYPSGKKTEIEFFYTTGNPPKYEATVNGKAMELPVYGDDYRNNIAPQLKGKMGFSFIPSGFGQPLMQYLGAICPEGSDIEEQYSGLPGREWINSLDKITIKCPATAKTHTIDIAYERDLSRPESLITSYVVKIDDAAVAGQVEPAKNTETGKDAQQAGPKAGHWEGTNPFVAFDVTGEGQVVNFMLNAPFVSTTCNIQIEQISVDGDEFLVDAKTGNAEEASIGIFVIQGKFDGNTVSGTHKVDFCGRTVALRPEERDWRAAWVGESLAQAPATPLPLPTPVEVKVLPTATALPTATLAPRPTDPQPSPAPARASVQPTYLADLTPKAVMVGYGVYSVGKFQFSSEDPADNIHKGDPIVVHGVAYPHGIFAHAASQIDFNLGEAHPFTELSMTIGMIEKISCGDGVIFSVWGDQAELYKSKVMYAWSDPLPVQIPLAGVRNLSLFVSKGSRGDFNCDWAIWGDPILN